MAPAPPPGRVAYLPFGVVPQVFFVAQFALAVATLDPAVAGATLPLTNDGEAPELNRINVLAFSAHNGPDEARVISGFLHASRLGLFDPPRNVLCPGCGGVLDAHPKLKLLRNDD